jgi:cysteine-rich repeat protein
MISRSIAPRRASKRLGEHLVVATVVAATFFACGEDSGRRLLPGGAAGTGNEGGAGAGGEGDSGAECGDGRRTAGEECDDGNREPGDGCDEECRIEPAEPACGNGVTMSDEECDDGNVQSGDGCDEECREERCGNRRVDAGEECDPPAAGACTASCNRLSPNCGDGRVQEDDGEQCDDRNDDPDDGCHECRRQCGNGRIDRALGEDCEPSLSSPGHCSEECRWLPVCGDGRVEPSAGEECDPSNGVTCIACRISDPGCDGAAGSAASSGCGGGGGSGGLGECVPQSSSELVQNGKFDTDTTGWLSPSGSVTLRAVDDGSPNPKAVEISFASGAVRAISGVQQCLPVRPDRLYEFSARYLIPEGAPQGVGAAITAFLYEGTLCEGPFLAPAGLGPEGRVRDAWTPYQFTVDTAAFPADATEARVLLRLGVVRPANVEGSRVLWDSVSLSDPGGLCGNCVVDGGETCDDGNQLAGDGCNATCRREECGDGVHDEGEACEDGNTVFGSGDACTPSCHIPSACDTCSATNCGAELEACLGLTGVAEAGRRAGTPLSVLCDELRSCVYETACHLATRAPGGVDEGAFLESCYCGTSGARCFDTPDRANGSCRAEVEAALEATDPGVLLGRMGENPSYPVFAALRELLACEDNAACASACVPEPRCGDRVIQDRNLDFTFVVDGEEVPCSDELTATDRGCSLEECDDGNEEPGDGCDEHCFLEACGNNVTQTAEQCDDGNDDPDDGCNNECESTCGNDVVDENEECDPPGGDHLCTQVEFMSDPAQCGCDGRCKRIVCGNEITQRPHEECDPPNELTGCESDCKFGEASACEACISTNPATAEFNDLYCKLDEQCVAVKQCVIQNPGCFIPVPAACYCGELEDYAACEASNFVPIGPCKDEIRAGAGGDGVDNATIVARFTDDNYPTGVAGLVLDEASRSCANECFPTSP